MCLWYAGSCTDILKELFDGQEEILNPQLWEFGGKVKMLSLRKALYRPYDVTTSELRAAVSEVEAGGQGKGQKAPPMDVETTEQVVANLKKLSKGSLIARAAALRKETEDVLNTARQSQN